MRNTAGRTNFPPLPLIEGEDIIETDIDQRFLTRRYTEKAVDFIQRHKEQPFFLYLAHSMPHIPLYVHPDFAGKSEHGLYGDVVQEIDWSMGEILKTLKECGVDENTLVIFTSDNGPWLIQGDHGGHAQPLRDGKGTKYDGGHRVACIMRWKGKMVAGSVATDILGSVDLFPTIAALTGAAVPTDRVIDGLESKDFLLGTTDVSPRNNFLFNDKVYCTKRWKLFLPGSFNEYNAQTGKMQNVQYDTVRLFNRKNDIGESHNVAAEHPEAVARLTTQLAVLNEEIRTHSRPLGKASEL